MTSISGGQTSAYLAANYPTKYNVFALVRINDINTKFKDKKYVQLVEDKIQKQFIGTAEDDTIIYTIFELEQFIGKEITWVSGDTFDEIIKKRRGWLPNKMHRYCTQLLKIEPIFNWWKENINEKITTQIGFRLNETRRADNMLLKCNEAGFIEYKKIAWQKPVFPLIENGILKNDIINFWNNKPVKFAAYNNCVGCFHRNPIFLRWQFQEHPEKMQWFAEQEYRGTWQTKTSYSKIKTILPQLKLYETDFTSCDSGYCEI